MALNQNPKLAVLIDADNASYSSSNLLLAEIAKYGTAHVKRAYGDWTNPEMKGWKEELLMQSIQPIQQFAYTHGKNATDSAMIIDAMDLLNTNKFDGFCLVSSDSDFTRLAARIRESGLTVYGIGERKTPQPFVSACDKFIHTENLVYLEELVSHSEVAVNHKNCIKAHSVDTDTELVKKLRAAVETTSDDDGWATLCHVGSLLIKKHPDFDSRNYGHSKLSGLIASSSFFETSRRSLRGGSFSEICVRDKRRQHKSIA